jgi:hypothetical protein
MCADIFYTIGATHQVCQDFALTDGQSYVIVSDGCSSAKDSDWGSRLLAKALEESFREKARMKWSRMPESLINESVKQAESYANLLKINKDCLAATLMAAYKTEEGIHAFISGDGSIVAKFGGSLQIIDHSYDSGAPYYLYYNLEDGLKDGYRQHFGNGEVHIETSVVEVNRGRRTVRDTLSGPSMGRITSHYFFPKEEFTCVGIVTDGLKSFVKQVKKHTSITNESVPFENFIGDLFSFKTHEGQYVHRRCQRAFREFHNQGIKHNDDFAMGVIGH